MLKLRLQRVGRRHEPSFRLVLTDSKNSTKSGRFKEILGSFDPRVSTKAKSPRGTLKADRIKYWMSVGAAPTATVHNLLVTHGIITAPKINVTAVSKKKEGDKKEEKEGEKALTSSKDESESSTVTPDEKSGGTVGKEKDDTIEKATTETQVPQNAGVEEAEKTT